MNTPSNPLKKPNPFAKSRPQTVQTGYSLSSSLSNNDTNPQRLNYSLNGSVNTTLQRPLNTSANGSVNNSLQPMTRVTSLPPPYYSQQYQMPMNQQQVPMNQNQIYQNQHQFYQNQMYQNQQQVPMNQNQMNQNQNQQQNQINKPEKQKVSTILSLISKIKSSFNLHLDSFTDLLTTYSYKEFESFKNTLEKSKGTNWKTTPNELLKQKEIQFEQMYEIVMRNEMIIGEMETIINEEMENLKNGLKQFMLQMKEEQTNIQQVNNELIEEMKNLEQKLFEDKMTTMKEKLHEKYDGEINRNESDDISLSNSRNTTQRQELGLTSSELCEKLIKIEEIRMKQKYYEHIDEDYNVYLKETHEKREERYEKERKQREDIMKKQLIERYVLVQEIMNRTELNQIEKWTNKYVDSILFDSKRHNWSKQSSQFDQMILNNHSLLIVIECKHQQLIGCYINSQINKVISTQETQKQQQNSNYDPECFLFTLRNKQLIQKKYPIKQQLSHLAFRLYDKQNERLFSLGNTDEFVIYKKEKKKECISNPSNVFEFDIIKENVFEVKRFIVFKMDQTNEIEKLKHLELDIITNTIANTVEKESENIKNKYNKEIETIENHFGMKWNRLIFDSDICQWNIKDSSFDSLLSNKQQTILLMETTDNKLFGGYIPSKIPNTRIDEKEIRNGKIIIDPKVCLFSLYPKQTLNNLPNTTSLHYNITSFNILPIAISLSVVIYHRNDDRLISLGNDLLITKNDSYSQSIYQHNHFNYNGKKNIFGPTETGTFSVKHILVFELNETQEMKNKRQKEKEERNKIEQQMNQDFFNTMLTQAPGQPDEVSIKEMISQVEQWTFSKADSLVFDSFVNNWKYLESEFDKKILGKSKLAFFIQDTEDNFFGGFINERIDKYCHFDHNKKVFDNNLISDYNSFVFSLVHNGKQRIMQKYDREYGTSICAFALFKPELKLLFQIGNGDIVVFKENYRNECIVQHKSYNYVKPTKESQQKTKISLFSSLKQSKSKTESQILHVDNENYLTGKRNGDKFTVKHIFVLQMKENEQLKHQRLLYENMRKKKYLEEQFNQRYSLVNNCLSQQTMSIIENTTNLNVAGIVFDSNIDNWSKNTTLFNEKIYGREKLVFIISDIQQNTVGFYLNARINAEACQINSTEWKQNPITDAHSFVFPIKLINFNGDKVIKNTIRPSKVKNAFLLYPKYHDILFSIGDNDITILKHDLSVSYISDFKTFIPNIKITLGTEQSQGKFMIQRIVVVQMIETLEQKQEKEEQRLLEIDNETNFLTNRNNELDSWKKTMKKLEEESAQQENNLLSFGKFIKGKIVTVQFSMSSKVQEIIKFVQNTTGKECCEVVFDSVRCSWMLGKSTFHKRVMGKQNLLFIIETDTETIGGFLNEKITRYLSINENKYMQGINDKYATLYHIVKGKPVQLDVQSKGNDVFMLGDENDDILFTFGQSAVIVYKQDLGMKVNYEDNTFGNQNWIVTSKKPTLNCMVKKVEVYQFI